jgi:hypothetical protein
MLEIVVGVVICGVMAKIADMENRSMVTWFGVTFLLCFLSLFLPLPYIRFPLAGVVAFAAMFLLKLMEKE